MAESVASLQNKISTLSADLIDARRQRDEARSELSDLTDPVHEAREQDITTAIEKLQEVAEALVDRVSATEVDPDPRGFRPGVVIEALCKVSAATGGVPKKFSEELGYAVRGIGDIMSAAQQAMAEHGIVILPDGVETLSIEHVEVGQYKKIWLHFDTLWHWRIWHRSGSWLPLSTFGEARDGGDKGRNKTQSAAYKYAVVAALSLGEQNDPDATTPPERESPGASGSDGHGPGATPPPGLSRSQLAKWEFEQKRAGHEPAGSGPGEGETPETSEPDPSAEPVGRAYTKEEWVAWIDVRRELAAHGRGEAYKKWFADQGWDMTKPESLKLSQGVVAEHKARQILAETIAENPQPKAEQAPETTVEDVTPGVDEFEVGDSDPGAGPIDPEPEQAADVDPTPPADPDPVADVAPSVEGTGEVLYCSNSKCMANVQDAAVDDLCPLCGVGHLTAEPF